MGRHKKTLVDDLLAETNQLIKTEPDPILLLEEIVTQEASEAPFKKNNIPPIVRQRNEYGFLDNVDYVFKKDGKVDWKKMINPEHLVFNREKIAEIEKVYGKKIEAISVTEVDDKYLLILLLGIRELASLRGFYEVNPKVDFVSDYKAVVTTNISWIGNNDSEMREEMYGDTAAATTENTNGFGRMFLETIAANRAFVRAVRNYLEIKIVGFDEVKVESTENKNNTVPSDPTSIHTILKQSAEELGITFDQFKEAVSVKYMDMVSSDLTKWSNFGDLVPAEAYKLTNVLKTKIQERKKAK